eukprot:TRINITY_DN7880_c0_g1_i1.p1 TRINITY_DN7880_c0_g1~~TRINITY_DN7880_c0_g1_i1.p1  ORF type:complete len:1069 (+),score=131.93 TRINITY_DN7880_c0_g1_i1:95-3301(+)
MPRVISKSRTLKSVGRILGDDVDRVPCEVGGAMVMTAAAGLGLWASLRARAVVVKKSAEPQIYLEHAPVPYSRVFGFVFIAVTAVLLAFRFEAFGTPLTCQPLCSIGQCSGGPESVSAANTSLNDCSSRWMDLPVRNSKIFIVAVAPRGDLYPATVTASGDGEHFNTTIFSPGVHPIGWLYDTGSSFNLSVTGPPFVQIVTFHSKVSWIAIEAVCRVLITLFCGVLLFLIIRRMDTRVHMLGPGCLGISQSLGIWLCILLVGLIALCNITSYFSPGSDFPVFIEEHGKSFSTYVMFAFSICVIRLCDLAMRRKPRNVLLVHIFPLTYLILALIIHGVATHVTGGQPFTGSIDHPSALGSPSPPRWVIAVSFTFHAAWLVYAVVTSIILINRLAKIPFTPYAAPILIFRWFTYFVAVHVVLHFCVELRLLVRNEPYVLLFRPDLQDVVTMLVFVCFVLLGMFPLKPSSKADVLPPVTPRGSWYTTPWSRKQVDALTNRDKKNCYFFGTLRHWRTWTKKLEKSVTPPPMFCLELADWLWAVSWEVHAEDPRMFFQWRSISMSEAAALAVLPDHFSSYARRYADSINLRETEITEPETPIEQWYASANASPSTRLYPKSPETPQRFGPSWKTSGTLAGSNARSRLRLHASGFTEETHLDPLHMRGHDKASYVMDWHRLGLQPMPVVHRGNNQGCVTSAKYGIAIAFRGTLNLDNVKSDLQACMATTQPNNLSGFCHEVLKVHTGFLDIWNNRLRRDVVVQVMNLMSTEHAAYAEREISWRLGGAVPGKPRRPLFITGHSLGGALAVLCAYDLKQQVIPQTDAILNGEEAGRTAIVREWRAMWDHEMNVLGLEFLDDSISGSSEMSMSNVSSSHSHTNVPYGQDVEPAERTFIVYTFGSPRVGNLHWRNSYNKAVPHTFRVVNGEDLVPHLPPSTGRIGGWAHVGHLVIVSTQGDIRIDPNTVERKMAYGPLIPWARTLNDHRMGAYREALLSVAHARGLVRAVRFVDDCFKEEETSAGAMVLQQLVRHQRGEAEFDIVRHKRGIPVVPTADDTTDCDIDSPDAHFLSLPPQ